MKLIFICVCCVIGTFAQTNTRFQPGANGNTGFQSGVGVNGNTGFPNTGFGTPNVNTNQGFNGQGTPPGFQPGGNTNSASRAPNTAGNAGFRTGFGPMGPNGLPFGSTGIGGQVFGPQSTRIGPIPPPMSPMALMMMSLARNPNNYRYATCTFNDTGSPVKGRADFRQFLIGEGRQMVNIRVQLSGLPTAVTEVERGLHIHEFGDIGDGCARVGPHFNPYQTPHGSQRNFAFLRHVGDLGNIRQSSDGMVSRQFADQVISLEGDNSVIGRSLVVKFERDDEGMGGSRESQVNGNTRNPIACCTIGRTTARNWYNPMSAADIQNMAATGRMPELTMNTNPINGGNNQNMNMNPNINTNINNPGFNNNNNPGFNNNNPGFNNNRPGFNNNNPGMNNNNNPGFNNNNPGMNNNNNPGMNNNINNPSFNSGGFGNLNNPGMNPNNLNTNTNLNSNINRPGPNQPGNTNFGASMFAPGATSGQTFNFAGQGKKKK